MSWYTWHSIWVPLILHFKGLPVYSEKRPMQKMPWKMSNCKSEPWSPSLAKNHWATLSECSALMPCWLMPLLVPMLQWTAKPNSRQNKPAVECSATPLRQILILWEALFCSDRTADVLYQIKSHDWTTPAQMRKLGFTACHAVGLLQWMQWLEWLEANLHSGVIR